MSGPYVTQAYDQSPVAAHAYPPTSHDEMRGMHAAVQHGSHQEQPAFLHRDSGYSGVPADDYSGEHMRHPSYEQQQYPQPPQLQHEQPAYTTSFRIPSTTAASPFPTPPPVSPAPYTAATLLQQHQANQHAFRSGGVSAQIFQNLAIRSSESPVASASTSSGTPSSHDSSTTPMSTGGEPSASTSALGGVNQQDGDFTQTFYDPFRIKHRRRTSPPQLKVLEYHFERNPKPDVTLRKSLSEQLDMTPREVQVWFQNRRAKVKKLKEKAEREAAAAAPFDVGDGLPCELPVPPPGFTALNAIPSQMPIPSPLQASPHHRGVYGHDVLAARRGSSPAVFGALPTPFDNSFRPVATAQPYIPLPPPPAASGIVPYPPPLSAIPYPSPLSSGVQSATPSPNDLHDHASAGPNAQAHTMAAFPPPLPIPTYLEGTVAAPPTRRLSLPARSLYGGASAPQPIPLQGGTSTLPPSMHAAPVQLATSAPSAPSYFDSHVAAPIIGHPAMLDGLGMGSGPDPLMDGCSPTSSFGEQPMWDGSQQQQQQQQFPLDCVAPGAGSAYAPQVPSALGQRVSAPADALAQAVDQFGQPLPYDVPQQPQWAPEYATAPPHQQQLYAPATEPAPFYGYSVTPAAAPLAQAPVYARRGSFANLVPIAEHPAPSAYPGGWSGQPSPPLSADGHPRRQSVVRRPRSGSGIAHPYAAAAGERRSPTGSEEVAL